MPEETLSAYALAGRLGISRTPVIEALKRLQREGLIEIIPHVGSRLVRPGASAIEELFALAAAARRAASEDYAEFFE